MLGGGKREDRTNTKPIRMTAGNNVLLIARLGIDMLAAWSGMGKRLIETRGTKKDMTEGESSLLRFPGQFASYLPSSHCNLALSLNFRLRTHSFA